MTHILFPDSPFHSSFDDDPVRMGRRSCAGVGQALGQGVELEAAVEAPSIAGKVALGVLGAEVVVGAGERGFDVAECRLDPIIPDPDDQFATAVAGHQAKLVSALMVSGMAARVEQRSPKARSRSLRVGKCLFATASLVSGHSRSAGCSSGV